MIQHEYIAFDIRNNKMIVNALILSGQNQLVTINEKYFNTPFSFFDGCLWFQYTGTKDKNDDKIFEGHEIRQTDSFNTIDIITGYMTYVPRFCAYKIMDEFKNYHPFVDNHHHEILSHITDNHLLKYHEGE